MLHIILLKKKERKIKAWPVHFAKFTNFVIIFFIILFLDIRKIIKESMIFYLGIIVTAFPVNLACEIVYIFKNKLFIKF